MKEYHIYGERKLCGEIKIGGAKNAILPILAATVMNASVSVIHNCPRLSDTFVAADILKSIGCDVKMEGSTIIVDSSGVYNSVVPEELVREMRSSIIFLGSILGRLKKVRISYPGGCELGARPIDLHLKGLRQLGTDIEEEHGFLICAADKAYGEKRPLKEFSNTLQHKLCKRNVPVGEKIYERRRERRTAFSRNRRLV